MTLARERLQELFLEAIERAPEAQGAFLDQACGDDLALRAELASLLEHHDEAPLIEKQPRARIPLLESNTRYRTLGELGTGGFGVVVQRFDNSLRRFVACKSPIVAEAAHEAALLREARLLSYLDHPGVVQVYDLGEDSSGVSYTMEMLNGECLSQHLADLLAGDHRMAVSEAIRIVTRLCETVANAHAKGVLHLDIKPDNIILQPFGRVSLIDWGLAHFYVRAPYIQHLALAREADLDSQFCRVLSGGTPAYMPPEQFEPEAKLAPTADIYSIGTLLFELLTGRLPFPECEDIDRLRSQKRSVVPLVRELRPEVSERLATICAGMLAPCPEDRPTTVVEILAELAALSDVGAGGEFVRLDPGQVLFEEGAEGTSAYQVLSGELEIVVADEVVTTRHAGDIVGELAMLSKTKRSATVRAGTKTVVRVIDWDALEDELSKVDPFVAHLMRKLSDKLIQTTRND